jgi:hypothetical protein
MRRLELPDVRGFQIHGFPHDLAWLGSTERMTNQVLNALTILASVATAFPELTPVQRMLVTGVWWCLNRLYGRDHLDK